MGFGAFCVAFRGGRFAGGAFGLAGGAFCPGYGAWSLAVEAFEFGTGIFSQYREWEMGAGGGELVNYREFRKFCNPKLPGKTTAGFTPPSSVTMFRWRPLPPRDSHRRGVGLAQGRAGGVAVKSLIAHKMPSGQRWQQRARRRLVMLVSRSREQGAEQASFVHHGHDFRPPAAAGEADDLLRAQRRGPARSGLSGHGIFSTRIATTPPNQAVL